MSVMAVVLVAAVLFVLAILGFVIQARKSEARVLAALSRVESTLRDRANANVPSRNDLDSVRAALAQNIVDAESRLTGIVQKSQSRERSNQPPAYVPSKPPTVDRYEEEPQSVQDVVGRLTEIANQILQQSPAPIDVIRSKTNHLPIQIHPPSSSGGDQQGYVVAQHAGNYYALPNAVKPTRVPDAWFNRSDFGFNDEIQRVMSLPRLTRRGNDYVVDEPGVFAK